MKQEIKVADKTYILKELKYKTLTELSDLSKSEGAKQLIILSTDMTAEDYDNLSLKDGMILQKAINELNGLNEDFQPPVQ